MLSWIIRELSINLSEINSARNDWQCFPHHAVRVVKKTLYPDMTISVDEEKSERGKTIAINQRGNDNAYYDSLYLITA